MMIWDAVRKSLGFLGVALLIAYGAVAGFTGSLSLDADRAFAQTGGSVPGNSLGNTSDSDFWRQVRRGVTGSVSIPDKKAGVLVQDQGDNWRAIRNGPISVIGGWAMLASLLVIAAFFALRGRIRIETGFCGRTVERFNFLERFTHWLTASSFVVLAVTGLNTLYGKYVLMPVIGQEAFATLALWSKITHDYIGFAFIIGLILMFVIWVRDNLASREDLAWIAVFGGLLTKGVHPPAKKFNFGQKMIFWLVILGGGALAYSGLILIFPYQMTPFGETFAFLNIFGAGLPTQLTVLQEMQLAQLWHAILGLVMVVLIVGHIYIGSLGMEGAFDAVSTGQVDKNWAREHHSLWLEEVESGGKAAAGDERRQPAE